MTTSAFSLLDLAGHFATPAPKREAWIHEHLFGHIATCPGQVVVYQQDTHADLSVPLSEETLYHVRWSCLLCHQFGKADQLGRTRQKDYRHFVPDIPHYTRSMDAAWKIVTLMTTAMEDQLFQGFAWSGPTYNRHHMPFQLLDSKHTIGYFRQPGLLQEQWATCWYVDVVIAGSTWTCAADSALEAIELAAFVVAAALRPESDQNAKEVLL